jgi:prepilin-type N-terminal cleavage/methylation domain-containing protein
MPRPAPPHAAAEDGFTLIEILVGLTISALIMVGLSSAMHSMNMGWQRTTALGERQNMLATGLRVAGGDLAHVERMFDDPVKPTRFLFVGDRSEAIFPVIERDGHNKRGIYWIRLFLRKSSDGIEFVRTRAPFEPGKQDLAAIAWQDEVVLLRGAFDISLSYLASGDGTLAWENDWPMQNRLPRQVRIDVAAVGRSPLVLPPFITALQNGAELACAAKDSQLCTLKSGGTLKLPEETAQ